MKSRRRLLTQSIQRLTVLLLWLGWWGAIPTVAQQGTVTWSSPANLSDTPQSSAHPAIVADDYGYVHVFWSEEVGGEPVQAGGQETTGNTIFYTRWDGVFWTPPLDVLLVPDEQVAEFVAADVDAENRLHAVWTGQRDFYYSTAPAWQANSAHAWSEPTVVATDSARSSWESDIVAAASGDLHIAYATGGDEAGIYHTRSDDGGVTWGLASKLSEPFRPLEESFANVEIITDGAGRIHAVWQTVGGGGFGQAIYYSRSTDWGESWSSPVQLGYREPEDYEASWPYITAEGESELHLIYVDGAHTGREHRISTDGGETWSAPYRIITEMAGVNGYVIPIVDGSGQMQLVVNMRARAGQVVGIYYARWLGDGWSPVQPVDVASPAAPSAHYAAAAMRLGNELHVVYNQLIGAEVWHVHGTLPGLDPDPTATLPEPQTPMTPAITVTTATPELTALPQQPSADLVGSPPIRLSASSVLLPGVGAALLLVLTVVMWTRVRH